MSPPDFPTAGLITSRLRLHKLAAADAAEVLRYQIENRQHLQPWEPARTDAFYSIEASERSVADMVRQMNEASALHLLIRGAEDDLLIGACHFTNIVRGPFQACHLGFSIDANVQGRGLMHEALERAIAYVFEVGGLHRVMANYRPENVRSGRLLTRLGFEIEGRARAYLKINGAWADHVLASRIHDGA